MFQSPYSSLELISQNAEEEECLLQCSVTLQLSGVVLQVCQQQEVTGLFLEGFKLVVDTYLSSNRTFLVTSLGRDKTWNKENKFTGNNKSHVSNYEG